MEYRILGKTGLKVTSVGVGCWQMGGLVDGQGWTGTSDEESVATIHRAQELGVNLLDTAEGYGRGHSEEVIGTALVDGRRDKFVIATKVRPLTDEPDTDQARRRVIEACEGSLRRLQTDYIDVYQLHAVPHRNTMATVMDTLAELKKQGKIRWYGISSNDTDMIRQLVALGDISMLQLTYNMLSRDDEVLRLARQEDLGTLIKGPLSSGALSGRYFGTVPQLDAQDRRQDRFTSDQAVAAFAKLNELLFLTEAGRRSMVQAALRFNLDTPGVTAVIPGAKSRAQLEDNAGAMDVPVLTDEERSKAIQIADEVGRPW